MEYHYANIYITISQELERQAMEQYRNGNAGDEKRSKDQDCLDGQRCSGYGHCSPVKRNAGNKSKHVFKIVIMCWGQRFYSSIKIMFQITICQVLVSRKSLC